MKLFYALLFLAILALSSTAKVKNVTRLTIFNPYSMSVEMEVKCDHDWKKKRFAFHKFIVVPGKKSTIIVVPNSLKKCQIWPKIIW